MQTSNIFYQQQPSLCCRHGSQSGPFNVFLLQGFLKIRLSATGGERSHSPTCSSDFTLSSSLDMSSKTSSKGRARNSSDMDTSTKCWWMKLLAASYKTAHIMVSANWRTPRQFLGWSLSGGRKRKREQEANHQTGVDRLGCYHYFLVTNQSVSVRQITSGSSCSQIFCCAPA